MDPLPGVIDTYAALGYSIIIQGERALYCEREI